MRARLSDGARTKVERPEQREDERTGGQGASLRRIVRLSVAQLRRVDHRGGLAPGEVVQCSRLGW